MSLKFNIRLHVLLLFGIEGPKARAKHVPNDGHLQQNLGTVALGSTRQLLVLERVPALLAVSYPEQWNRDFPQELDLVVSVLVVDGHFQYRVYVFDVAEKSWILLN